MNCLTSNKADLVFTNGPVITVNAKNEIAEAVAVKGNKIAFAGKEAEAKDWIGENTKIIDLKGRALLPGFIDSHIHFEMYGMKQSSMIDLDYSKAKSIEDIKSLIRKEAAKKKPGQWIQGWGYDHNKLAEGRHPTKQDLDEAAPLNPVQCTRACGHMGVYNSLALEICGIENASGYEEGEVVVENGKLTGLLQQAAHLNMGKKIKVTEDDVLGAIIAANALMLKAGITTVHDAGSDGSIGIKVMEHATRNGKCKVRIYPMIFDLGGKEPGIELVNNFISTGITTGFGNEHFKIGPAKIMMDGSSSAPSSATRKPYSHDPNLKGILSWNQEETDEIVIKVHNAGFQVTAHCLGDMAIEIYINAIEKALKENPRSNHRHRIEHCGLPDKALIKKIKKLGLIPIANPGFIDLNGRDYNRYYGDRVNYMFPLKTYLEEGIIAAIGSDTPVIKENPMYGLYGALARADGRNGDVVGENQKIGLMDAIRMYTYNGAYASFEEDFKGSIEEGKLADLVVLSENILETPVERIKEVVADITVIDGEIVYRR